LPGSTMELATGGSSGSLYAVLPMGLWDCRLFFQVSAAGSAVYYWQASTTAQTNFTILLNDKVVTTASTVANFAAYLRVNITGPPSTFSLNGIPCFKIFVSSGTATGWTIQDARIWIRPVPSGMTTLLTHRNLNVRGLAWVHAREQMSGRAQLASQVAQALKAHGVETKDPAADADKKLHKRVLAELARAPPAPRRHREELYTDDDVRDEDADEPDYERKLELGPQLRAPIRGQPGRMFLQEAKAGVRMPIESDTKEEKQKEQTELVAETIPAITKLLSSGWSIVRSEGTATASGQSAPARA